MAVKVMFHGHLKQHPLGGALLALPEQIGPAHPMADGETYTIPTTGVYHIRATSDCLVRASVDVIANANDGDDLGAGQDVTYYLNAGSTLAVSAAA